MWGRGSSALRRNTGYRSGTSPSPGAQRGWGRASEKERRRAKIRKVKGQVSLV